MKIPIIFVKQKVRKICGTYEIDATKKSEKEDGRRQYRFQREVGKIRKSRILDREGDEIGHYG